MKTRAEFGKWLAAHNYQTAVEVGVCRGEFSRVLLSTWPGKLFMVDAWKYYDDPNYRDIANAPQGEHEANLQKAWQVQQQFAPRAQIVRGDSFLVAQQFADGFFDVVYLDANHTYDHVKKELAIWAPKVKNGGALGGHDFLDAELPDGSFGVKRAALEFFAGRLPNILTAESYPTWLYYV